MNVTKKKLEKLRQEIIALRTQQSKINGEIQQGLGDLSREILDILYPSKKGYIRFQTTTGWCSFKKSRMVKKRK